VFLPIRHTQLEVSNPVAARRDFIEFLFWVPHQAADRAEWGLRWSVYEIVGAEALMVTVDGLLANVMAARPPASATYEEMARLRVNQDGEAEWVVLGTNPRTGVIPPGGITLMRSDVLGVAGALEVATSLGQAQTTTADGVDMFVRGDYQRAVDMLKPIAEAWPSRDHVAEFFMATLYENGQAVGVDLVRACALYTRASFDHANPIGQQAIALLGPLQGSLSPEDFRRCIRLASVGFDRVFQPATFTLGPGHWIAIDPDGATITYQGKEKRTELALGTHARVFLPFEHTELAVGPSLSTRRHFIEFFAWMPGEARQAGPAWTLTWHVSEVVGRELISIVTEPLMTIAAERPPTDSTGVDVHSLARLRVNDRGDAEWAVLSGKNPRAEAIESEAERQATIEQRRARQAAEAKVDWTRVSDTHRAPTMTYADAEGCGNVFLYGWSVDRSEVITVRANKDVLGLSTAPRSFDIASQGGNLELVVHTYQRPLRSFPFCTDAPGGTGPEETWRAARGTVTIELSPPGVLANAPQAYRATVHIVGAEFVSATGVRVRQTQAITLSAIVVWIFG
jgi:hypothetical protein